MLGGGVLWKHASLPLALLWVKIWGQAMCHQHSPVTKLGLLGHGTPWACEAAGSSHWPGSPTCGRDTLQKALLEPSDLSIDVVGRSWFLLLASTRLDRFVRGREKAVLFAWLCLLSVLKSRSSQQWKPVLGELPVTGGLSPLSSLHVMDDKCQRPCYSTGLAGHATVCSDRALGAVPVWPWHGLCAAHAASKAFVRVLAPHQESSFIWCSVGPVCPLAASQAGLEGMMRWWALWAGRGETFLSLGSGVPFMEVCVGKSFCCCGGCLSGPGCQEELPSAVLHWGLGGPRPAALRAAFQVCLPHSLQVWLQLVWSDSYSLSARRVCSEGGWWRQPGCCDPRLGRVGVACPAALLAAGMHTALLCCICTSGLCCCCRCVLGELCSR